MSLGPRHSTDAEHGHVDFLVRCFLCKYHFTCQKKKVLGGKFIAINACTEKQKRSQINNLTLCLKELEIEEQTQPKGSRRKKVIKIREEINETTNKNNRRDKPK